MTLLTFWRFRLAFGSRKSFELGNSRPPIERLESLAVSVRKLL